MRTWRDICGFASKGFKMKTFDIYCSMDKETGKYTGAACNAESPTLENWRTMELCAGVSIKKMDALEFVTALDKQGVDLEKMAYLLESKK